jgi:hypothetical protein
VGKQGNERLPQFPSSPEGIARMEHLPTVEASIRYWEAVRVYAIETRQPALELTAIGLRSSYERALQELTNAEQSQKKKAPPCARRGRLQPEPLRRNLTED